MKFIIFDTETTGIPKNYKAPVEDSDNWPRLVQLAYAFYDNKELTLEFNAIIKPDGFVISEGATEIHGITTEMALEKGLDLKSVMTSFLAAFKLCDFNIAHNHFFDRRIMGAEMIRTGFPIEILKANPAVCTMMLSTKFCALPQKNGRGIKWPKLEELHKILFNEEMTGAHNAMFDVRATARCFFKLVNKGVINLDTIQEKFDAKKALSGK